MAIPAKEVSYLHSFLTRQLQRQHFDKPVGRSNLEIRFLSVTMLPGFRLCATKTFSVSKSSMPAERHRPDAIPSMQQDMEKDHVQIVYLFTPACQSIRQVSLKILGAGRSSVAAANCSCGMVFTFPSKMASTVFTTRSPLSASACRTQSPHYPYPQWAHEPGQ